jgi:hypothetical protein
MSMQHRCLVTCCPNEGKIVHTNEIFHNIQLILSYHLWLISYLKCLVKLAVQLPDNVKRYKRIFLIKIVI